MGSHGDCVKKFIDLTTVYLKILQYPHGAFLHDVLGTGTGSHPGNFRPDALPDDRAAECPPGDSACMHLHYFITGCVTDRGFALHHVLTAHEDFCTVRVFMTVEQFSCHNAAEFFDLVDIPVNRLLEDFVDNLEIPGKICTFQAPGQVDVYIEIGDENDRSFSMTVYFDQFFYVFYSDAGEVYTDVGNCCLNIREFPGKRLVRSFIWGQFFNKSSHPDNCFSFASLVFLYNIYVLCC